MLHALLRTFPARAMMGGAAVKVAVLVLSAAVGLPAWLSVVDTLGTVAIIVGAAWFAFRGLSVAKQRLLWRVRRRLIVSYILIGVVPAILIAAFFLLGGLLLFSNFSSYLLQSRLQALTNEAASIAATTAIEIQRAGGRDTSGILARRARQIDRDYPGASLAAIGRSAPCDRPSSDGAGREIAAPVVAGPWAHVEPPRSLPPWLDCAGFQGILAYANPPRDAVAGGGQAPQDNRPNPSVQLLARAVAFPDVSGASEAVVVDLLVNAPLKDRLRRETGVDLANVRAIVADAPLLSGRAVTSSDVVQPEPSTAVASVSFPEIVDWSSGLPRGGTLLASMQLSVREMYSRISAAQGSIANRSFGQGLLVVLLVIGVLFLLIEALALIVGLTLAKSITGSVHALFLGTERVRRGDLSHRIAIRTRDQLGELAGSFNSMTDSIETLLQQQAEKKRLEEELRIAHEIQMSLLPRRPPTLAGWTATALCVPAREVGGDYYDFLTLDDHRIAVLIADVSGKGTSAALYMAELKGLVLALSRIHRSPRDLLVAVNRIMAEHLDTRSFITMTYALLDLRARTLTYARAGHTPLMRIAGNGAPLQVLAPDGLVIGLHIDDGQTFERLLIEETIPVTEGDLFALFTDGITEAMDAEDELFGEERLGQLLAEHANLPPEELRERILDEIASFVGGAPQHDDMTLILFRIGTTVAGDVPAAEVPVAAGAEA